MDAGSGIPSNWRGVACPLSRREAPCPLERQRVGAHGCMGDLRCHLVGPNSRKRPALPLTEVERRLLYQHECGLPPVYRGLPGRASGCLVGPHCAAWLLLLIFGCYGHRWAGIPHWQLPLLVCAFFWRVGGWLNKTPKRHNLLQGFLGSFCRAPFGGRPSLSDARNPRLVSVCLRVEEQYQKTSKTEASTGGRRWNSGAIHTRRQHTVP